MCDTKTSRTRKMTREWGVEKLYTDYAKLLADPQIELVERLVHTTCTLT